MPDTTFRAFVSIRSRDTGAPVGHRWSQAVASPDPRRLAGVRSAA